MSTRTRWHLEETQADPEWMDYKKKKSSTIRFCYLLWWISINVVFVLLLLSYLMEWQTISSRFRVKMHGVVLLGCFLSLSLWVPLWSKGDCGRPQRHPEIIQTYPNRRWTFFSPVHSLPKVFPLHEDLKNDSQLLNHYVGCTISPASLGITRKTSESSWNPEEGAILGLCRNIFYI